MTDRFAEFRGKWDRGGTWWCDCGRNPSERYLCKRCEIRRPLKGSPIYELRDPLQHAGFMRCPKLVLVTPPALSSFPDSTKEGEK